MLTDIVTLPGGEIVSWAKSNFNFSGRAFTVENEIGALKPPVTSIFISNFIVVPAFASLERVSPFR
jgi:hypothetical protein